MKKETNGQSADIQLNRLPLSPIQAAPFLKKKRALKIDNSLVQRQIALLFPSWNFSYNPLYVFLTEIKLGISRNEYLFTVTGVKKMKWFLSLTRCHFQP